MVYNYPLRGDCMAVKKVNMTLDPTVFEDFCYYASRKGIKISTWTTVKMKEFVDEEKFLEEMRKNKK